MSISSENRELAAKAAGNYFKDHLPEAELNSCLSTIKLSNNSVSAQGSYICAIFYWRITLNVGNKQFTGNAGGIGGIGGGSTNGDIYLASGVTIDELESNTTSFQFNAAVVYLNVNFFDSSSKFLGSYQGGGIATCGGSGGGSGSWS